MTAAAGPLVITVTRRQRAVIGELARDGATDRQIARRLGTTETAARQHVRQVLRKAGQPNRTALVVALLRGELKLRTEDRRRQA